MGNRRIFIGDVHGHYDGLMRLLEVIAPDARDQVYFLGDLIDRGPKSAQVVSFVRRQGYVSLLGNHEQMLLEVMPHGKLSYQALQAWLFSGGQTTMQSYGKSDDLLMEHVTWMRSLPTHLDLGDIWLSHAGMHPALSVADHTAQEYCWVRDEFHSMTRPYFPDKLIITGHTITFTLPNVPPGAIAQGQGWLDIDTGAYHPRSGWLTGLDHTHQRVYQVNVQTQESRVLPLAEASVQIDPARVMARRRQPMTLEALTKPV
ncbi:serine/threonine protein phosphatase [Thermoleptolyngbya sichuanensis A183]|uniref:Serine/threonine protein phosphatase n=1 Tax=Thermoleptolyngbya sichuanensis A183 TaxID=2737172 RepID=A0A6M8BC20_9CYAN|nr:metallophosphoesterase [Thermoleptolyngbya sichuanensis]QKD80843.1 serine/threonine protein phosphatase [Thermoleptolyngbya sichuanensis A183]